MEKLTLVRIIPQNSGPFRQYVPSNMQEMLENKDNICVGVIYGLNSCAVAIAELTNDQYYLRSVFVDPKVRLCGLGTYILRGITGEVRKIGAAGLKFLYSPSMLEGARLSGIFKKVGFRVDPVATSFSILFEEIKAAVYTREDRPGVKILSLSTLPEDLWEKYQTDADNGLIPPYADVSTAQGEILDACTLACVVEGRLAGIIIITRMETEVLLRGLYIYEGFRKTSVTGLLIGRAIEEGSAILSDKDIVRTTALNFDSYALCERYFMKNCLLKETEFCAEYHFINE